MKTYNINKNVYEASLERFDFIYSNFERVYVSFSGGKDSGVMLNMAIDAARRAGKLPVTALFIDMEAQYKHTIDFISKMMSKSEVNPVWVCLPIHLRNAVSQFQSHWICWDELKKEAWVREMPANRGVISDVNYFPFFRKGMEFEEFVEEFGLWYSGGQSTACIVGIRSDESINRFRTIKDTRKETYQGRNWSTRIKNNVYNFYPLYDWRTKDLWICNGKMNYDYNKIYDLMHMAGVSIHQMRLCQPYGDDQRKGLYLFKVLEPETWGKVVNRVEGANFGNRYSKNQTHIMGNYKINLPPGHTYKSYSKLLLSTMPPYMEEHYRKKIFKFLLWWKNHRREFNIDGVPDYADMKLESRKLTPSWRRICKVLLKNDYWCKGLSFSQTKKEMETRLKLIAKYQDKL